MRRTLVLACVAASIATVLVFIAERGAAAPPDFTYDCSRSPYVFDEANCP